MNINRSNYEAYFIDYLDGQLADNLVDELLDFLKENPDLAEELQAVSSIKLEAEPISFQAKHQLIKGTEEYISDDDHMAIAYLEGDLTESEKEQYILETSDDDASIARLQAFQKTKLQADTNIQYPSKDQLYRKGRKVILLWVSRVAAMLLLFFTTYAIISRNQAPQPPVVVAESAVTADEKPSEIESQPTTTEPEQELEKPVTAKTTAAEKAQPVKPVVKQEPIASVTVEEENPTETIPREAVPQELKPITPELDERNFLASIQIKEEKLTASGHPNSLTVDEYLAYKLLDAPKGDNFNLNSLANASLKAAENISNDRFEVQRNENGRVQHLKFESRLFAFSIPVKKRR